MTWELARDIILDSLKDSGLVFIFVLLLHVLISFIEQPLKNFLVKRKKLGTLFSSLFGLIPQCGASVMGAELYIKKYISIGALVALFLSCSDEALIALLTSGIPEKMIMVLPIIGIKFVIGFLVGLVVDLIFKHQEIEEVEEVEIDHECSSHHHHENDSMHRHLVHPLLHSLQVFAYVLVINLALGFLIGCIGEENFTSFMLSNKYLTPLYASIIGLIPNCASSLLLSELYINNSLSFGALMSGLFVNAGLGMTVLLKNRNSVKNLPYILVICFVVALISGYIICLIDTF